MTESGFGRTQIQPFRELGGDNLTCPDGLKLDRTGTLWIQTDMSSSVMGKDGFAELGHNTILAIATTVSHRAQSAVPDSARARNRTARLHGSLAMSGTTGILLFLISQAPLHVSIPRSGRKLFRGTSRRRSRYDTNASSIEHDHRFTEQEHGARQTARTKPCTDWVGRPRLTWVTFFGGRSVMVAVRWNSAAPRSISVGYPGSLRAGRLIHPVR